MCPAKLANNFFDVLKNNDDLSIHKKLELLPPVMTMMIPFFLFFVVDRLILNEVVIDSDEEELKLDDTRLFSLVSANCSVQNETEVERKRIFSQREPVGE